MSRMVTSLKLSILLSLSFALSIAARRHSSSSSSGTSHTPGGTYCTGSGCIIGVSSISSFATASKVGIIIVCVVVGVIVLSLSLCCWLCCCRPARRLAKARAFVHPSASETTSYTPLPVNFNEDGPAWKTPDTDPEGIPHTPAPPYEPKPAYDPYIPPQPPTPKFGSNNPYRTQYDPEPKLSYDPQAYGSVLPQSAPHDSNVYRPGF